VRTKRGESFGVFCSDRVYKIIMYEIINLFMLKPNEQNFREKNFLKQRMSVRSLKQN